MDTQQEYRTCRECNGTGKVLVRKTVDSDQPRFSYYTKTTVELYHFEPCDDCYGRGKILT